MSGRSEIEVLRVDRDTAQQQIAALTQERDELLKQPYGTMRRVLILRAEKAEQERDALQKELHEMQVARSSPSRGSGEEALASATGTTPASAQARR